MSETIASFEKNSREEVRVSIDEFHGRKLINIRVFYRNSAGEWLPGKQGLAVGVEQYPQLAGAMVQLGERLQSLGLVPMTKS